MPMPIIVKRQYCTFSIPLSRYLYSRSIFLNSSESIYLFFDLRRVVSFAEIIGKRRAGQNHKIFAS